MFNQINEVMLRRGLAPCFALMLGLSATTGFAQEDLPDLSTNGQSVSGQQNANLNSSPTAQVVVQSVGGGSGYRMTPNAPGMPSFAGGPCIGTAVSASAAIPGVSLGGGSSTEDEACQRRNWVQTLLGASQHMSPEDSLFMKRLAIEVMRDDEYLSPAFSRLGVEAPIQAVEENFWGQPRRVRAVEADSAAPVSRASAPAVSPAVTPAPQPIARAATSCVTVVAASAPSQMKALLGSQGCEVVVR
jgi:hypothetical protein